MAKCRTLLKCWENISNILEPQNGTERKGISRNPSFFMFCVSLRGDGAGRSEAKVFLMIVKGGIKGYIDIHGSV